MQWGSYASNIVAAVLMTGLIWHAFYGLTYLRENPGKGHERKTLYVVTLLFCGIEYALWISSCFWADSVYYWLDIMLSAGVILFLPAVRKAVIR